MKNLLFTLALATTSTFSFAQSKATKKLFDAIERNDVKGVEKALDAGASVDSLNDDKAPTNTALIRSVQLNRVAIVDLLISRGANVNLERPLDHHTALMVAARHDLSDIAKKLIEEGADVNFSTLFGRTALQIAALWNSEKTAKVILSSPDADVNIRPNLCALAIASRQGHAGIVKLLKSESNDICLERAIFMARSNKNEEILKLLTE